MNLPDILNVTNTMKTLEEDYYLSKFLSINSDSKFKNNVQLTVTDQLNKLTKGLQVVEQLICEQIHENHDELCNQVTWIENLESIINEISSQIQNLQSSIEILKYKVVNLFVKVQTQVITLNRLHVVCDLLRKIIRIQNLTALALDKDSVLSSNSMFEIGELIEDINLKKITFLSKNLIKLSNLYDKRKLLG